VPYSVFHVSPSPNRSYRTMSSSGAEHTAADSSDGHCVTAAPTSSPPFDPPHTASRSADVAPEEIRYSAAARKSSNTFCLRSSIPTRCHSSPSSLPPRSPATAYTPPASTQARMLAE
jgi:hypothetical protein